MNRWYSSVARRTRSQPNGAKIAAAAALAVLTFVEADRAFAQATPAPAEEPTMLSPFEVRVEADVGYQAGNTTTGSRLNSRLKDTPASVSAFTPEFLSDIAANNLEEMLGYANNVEQEFEDGNVGFNDPAGRTSTGNDHRFRIRGILANSSRDFVESSEPNDLYNVERAEVSSGPNSILFGLGSAGGAVALTGKKANFNRDRMTLKGQFGSNQFQRYETDLNKVLVPKVLSVRMMALYQNSQGWRRYSFSDQKRLNGAVAYRPFKKTSINATFERGKSSNSTVINWNALDAITAWDDAGRQTGAEQWGQTLHFALAMEDGSC